MSETAETGPVLGEDALSAALDEWHRQCHLGATQIQAMRRVINALAPHVAALVAEAERRGAQAERDRWHERLRLSGLYDTPTGIAIETVRVPSCD